MSQRYSQLTSPIKLRGKVLKSRFIYPVAQVHFLQGPELYPGDPVISYYTSLAKNGCALMIAQDLTSPTQRTQMGHDSKHYAMYDLYDKGCQNYFTQLAHFVHCYGSYIGTELSCDLRLNYSVNDPTLKIIDPRDAHAPDSDDPLKDIMAAMMRGGPEGPSPGTIGFPGSPMPRNVYFTPEKIEEYIDHIAQRALLYKSFGYDAGLIDMGDEFYCGEFLMEYKNFRTDEYGGSFENRLRFPVQVVAGLRKRLGDDFILIVNAPGTNGYLRGPMVGLTLEESVAFIKAIEPYVDIIRMREADNLAPDECKTAEVSRQLKDMGVSMPIAVSTNFMELDKLNAIISSGDADLITSARMFICNENLGKILKDGNGEDLNPCLDCGICRGSSATGDWMSHCTINPRLGMEHRVDRMIEPVERSKKIAVIGGGPAGMKCALWLKERGHTPVIYEKSDALGGQIATARYPDFKWKLLRYLDFLIAQVKNNGIEVRLGTEATPEMIKTEGYDVVISATGAAPKKPEIKGAENAKWNAVNIYGNEDKIGKKVVVIGGSSAPSEAAIYLSRLGHEVTLICRKCMICHDLNPIRARTSYNILAVESGVKLITDAVTTKIENGAVYYTDNGGNHCSVECDDVLAAGGMEPRSDTAISFHGCADEFYIIGDSREVGSIRTALRDAYALAIRI